MWRTKKNRASVKFGMKIQAYLDSRDVKNKEEQGFR